MQSHRNLGFHLLYLTQLGLDHVAPSLKSSARVGSRHLLSDLDPKSVPRWTFSKPIGSRNFICARLRVFVPICARFAPICARFGSAKTCKRPPKSAGSHNRGELPLSKLASLHGSFDSRIVLKAGILRDGNLGTQYLDGIEARLQSPGPHCETVSLQTPSCPGFPNAWKSRGIATPLAS